MHQLSGGKAYLARKNSRAMPYWGSTDPVRARLRTISFAARDDDPASGTLRRVNAVAAGYSELYFLPHTVDAHYNPAGRTGATGASDAYSNIAT